MLIPDLNKLQPKLNTIYQPTLIDWQVRIANQLTDLNSDTIAYDLPNENGDSDNALDCSIDEVTGAYTKEMKVVIKAFEKAQYNGYDKDTYVLFLMNKPNDNKEGMMPFKRQFGFIFTYRIVSDKFARTCAHELGYGVFTLRHTFSKNAKYVIPRIKTDNLMDYSNGTTLHKWQWDYARYLRDKITSFAYKLIGDFIPASDFSSFDFNNYKIEIKERYGIEYET